MRIKYRSLLRAGKVTSAFLGFLLSISISTGVQALNDDEEKINQEINKVKEILDSWNGQRESLEQVRRKLSWVLAADPKNHHALMQATRYQLNAGYINSRYAKFGSSIYVAGNYIPGTLKQAEETILAAIRINPSFADGYVLLGHIQIEQTKLTEAEKSLERAEDIGTESPWLQLNWARLHIVRGEHEKAMKRWNRVLKSGTSNANARSSAYRYLIENHIRVGEHDKAVALYRDQIKANPTNAWVRGNFASYLSETLGRNDEAIIQAREALKIMNYGMGREILALALYRKWADLVAQGNEAEAEKYYQEAWEIYPALNEVMVYSASLPGSERLTKALVTKKGVSIDASAGNGSTALLIATNRNREQTVKTLLDLNANPNIHDNSGWTPLLSAADEGNTGIVKILLAKGADIRATLKGRDAAALAERKGYKDLAELLKQHAAGTK